MFTPKKTKGKYWELGRFATWSMLLHVERVDWTLDLPQLSIRMANNHIGHLAAVIVLTLRFKSAANRRWMLKEELTAHIKCVSGSSRQGSRPSRPCPVDGAIQPSKAMRAAPLQPFSLINGYCLWTDVKFGHREWELLPTCYRLATDLKTAEFLFASCPSKMPPFT